MRSQLIFFAHFRDDRRFITYVYSGHISDGCLPFWPVSHLDEADVPCTQTIGHEAWWTVIALVLSRSYESWWLEQWGRKNDFYLCARIGTYTQTHFNVRARMKRFYRMLLFQDNESVFDSNAKWETNSSCRNEEVEYMQK